VFFSSQGSFNGKDGHCGVEKKKGVKWSFKCGPPLGKYLLIMPQCQEFDFEVVFCWKCGGPFTAVKKTGFSYTHLPYLKNLQYYSYQFEQFKTFVNYPPTALSIYQIY
jgi:hypothetical protein